MSMNLKAIARPVRELIQSAQVITCLANAVKELVENAIDAGATSITIRLVDSGLTTIDVSDNGRGIAKADLENVAVSHATSKLEHFRDLEALDTLGFRGEALSSLCALAKVSLTSCIEGTYPLGNSVEYDHEGLIESSKVTAAGVGTSIKIADLFGTLPVRRADFTKNVKRELIRTTRLLQAYAAVHPEIRFEATNQTNRGKIHLIGSNGTSRSSDGKRTLLEIFGVKALFGIVPVDQQAEDDLKISGFISNVTMDPPGQCDRQLLYVNKRPCHIPAITRSINEAFSTLGGRRNPFFMLNIITPATSYDVNVTPDKRTIYLHNEVDVVQSISQALHAIFGNDQTMISSSQYLSNPVIETTSSTLSERFNMNSSSSATVLVDDASAIPNMENEPKGKVPTIDRAMSTLSRKHSGPSLARLQPKQQKLDHLLQREVVKHQDSDSQESEEEIVNIASSSIPSADEAEQTSALTHETEGNTQPTPLLRFHKLFDRLDHSPESFRVHRERVTISSTIISLPAVAQSCETTSSSIKNAGVADDPQAVEQALTLNITKKDFFCMNIIGQFNLGFIITERRGELFIVDQHASDEKANYERLIRDTIIQSQVMARPYKLALNNVEMLSLGEAHYRDLLHRNGFQITHRNENNIDEFWLTALPVSKNITFNMTDLLELLTLYETTHDTSRVRCTKAKRMFASRACRSSIMIGTALKREQMESVIYHMGELDLPWNCPHGRPTMRHLIGLDSIPRWLADYD